MGLGLASQMLAGAEADLEPDLGGGLREKAGGIKGVLLGEVDLEAGQQAREEITLARAEAAAAAPAIDDPPSLRAVVRGALAAQAKAKRNSGTRSRRSQENPPSASGARPKWP